MKTKTVQGGGREYRLKQKNELSYPCINLYALSQPTNPYSYIDFFLSVFTVCVHACVCTFLIITLVIMI